MQKYYDLAEVIKNDNVRPRIHSLKIDPKYFLEVFNKNKTFEVRKNDRNYEVGDIVILREYVDNKYTGRQVERKIGYILEDKEYVKEDYVVFSLI